MRGVLQRAGTNVETDTRIVTRFRDGWLNRANGSVGGRIVRRMGVGEREPVQGENKQGRTLFFVMLGLIVFLFVVFLLVRPRGSQAGPPAQSTHAQ